MTQDPGNEWSGLSEGADEGGRGMERSSLDVQTP